jgi:hypothetical protein
LGAAGLAAALAVPRGLRIVPAGLDVLAISRDGAASDANLLRINLGPRAFGLAAHFLPAVIFGNPLRVIIGSPFALTIVAEFALTIAVRPPPKAARRTRPLCSVTNLGDFALVEGAAALALPILLAAVGFRFTFPAIVPDGLAGAALVDCVARLLPLAVLSLPPRAVAPVPPDAKRPRLSRE